MGVDAGSVYSSIRIRLTDLDNDLKGVYARLNQLESNITKTTVPAQKNFKDMFLAVASGQAALDLAKKGFDHLKDGIKESIKVATESQEMISKYDVVFAGMGDASEKAAKQFSDSFDLAGATSKEMLANTGNLLQGMGATKEESLALSLEVNTLASDLASFTNNEGGASTASEALTKALLGEKEQMKSLGIAILDSDVNLRVAKNGQSELTGTALKLAKAQATLQLITEQSKNAIGDYARTQDSAANTQKRAEESTKKLQIAVGTALNPAVTLLAGLWAKVSGALSEVIEKQNELRSAQQANKEGNATYEQRILLLQKERRELEDTLKTSRVYDEEGKEIQTGLKNDLENQIVLIDKRIAGIVRAQQAQSLADKTKSDADKKAAKDAADKVEKEEKLAQAYKESRDIVKNMLEDEKTEYQKIQDQIDKLSAVKGKTAQEEKERLEAIAALKDKQWDIEVDKEMEVYQLRRDAFEDDFVNQQKNADQNAKNAEKEIDAIKKKKEAQKEFFDMSMNLSSSLASLASALYDRQKELLDQQLEDALEAAGVKEATAVETAQAEYDAAVAEGDAETIVEKEKALKKAKIEEEYAERLAELQYESAMVAWGFQLAQTTATAAMSILNAFNAAMQLGPGAIVAAPIYEALAIAAGTASVAAVAAAMPVKSYATGGIVAPSNGGVLTRQAENGYGEVDFNTGPTGKAFISSMASEIAKTLSGNSYLGNSVINLDGKELARVVTQYQKANKV